MANPASLQRRLCHQYLRHGAPASSIFPMALRCSAPASNISARRPSHQHLRHGALASNISDKAPRPATNLIWRRRVLRFGYQSGAPGPDLLTRSIEMRPLPHQYMCACFFAATLSCCSDIANLSAHLHRLPTPPTYLRQMRLPHGRDAGVVCWIWL